MNLRRPSFLVICILCATVVHSQVYADRSGSNEDPELKQAMKDFDEKKYESALRRLDKLVKKDPRNSDLKYEQALALALLKKEDSAVHILRGIASSDQAKDSYYQLLANCYSELDDTVKAREVLLEGSKRFPESGKMYLELGLLQLQQHHVEEALDQFEEGIQVDPAYSSNYYWAARSYAPGNEKIWTVLYGELLMNVDPNPTHVTIISELLYAAHNSVYDQFKTSRAMVYSKTQHGSADASQAQKESFEEVFDRLMTRGAEPLKYFKDFEIPVASIDTMQTVFVKEWYAGGYDKTFPNPMIERHKLLLDQGMHTAYTFYLMQFAKPIEFKAYYESHKHEYAALVRWLQAHPLNMNAKNRFSRFFYN